MDKSIIENYPRYERYKDSGVNWLGKIPEQWKVERLGSLLKEVSEKNHPDLDLLSITREKGVIKRNVSDMDSNHNFIPDDLSGYKKLEAGQFGMNKMKAWQGSYGISPYTGIVSPAYYIFDIHPELNKEFFSLAIRSRLYISYFGSASDGVRIGQWDLNKTRMRQIRFAIPTDTEQKKIVNFINDKTYKIEKAIELKRKQIEKLEEYKQIVIQNAVTKGLDPDVPMKDSGVDWIGEIPEHWQTNRLGVILSEVSSKNHPDLQLLSVTREKGVIKRDIEDYDSNHNYIPDDLTGYKKIVKGQFGMNKMKAWQGSYGVSKYTGIISPAYYVFDIAAELNKDFFSTAIRSRLYINYFRSASDGVRIGQWDLNKVRMKAMVFVIPPIEEQIAIEAYLQSKFEQTKKLVAIKQQEIDLLTEYKTILINEAVTGKIKIA